jgi:hypothetical protein
MIVCYRMPVHLIRHPRTLRGMVMVESSRSGKKDGQNAFASAWGDVSAVCARRLLRFADAKAVAQHSKRVFQLSNAPMVLLCSAESYA